MIKKNIKKDGGHGTDVVRSHLGVGDAKGCTNTGQQSPPPQLHCLCSLCEVIETAGDEVAERHVPRTAANPRPVCLDLL